MVKPHIEALVMAREFSEFSNEYSTKKADYFDIRNNLDAIMHIRTTLDGYEQQLSSLRTQKSNLVLFSAFLTDEERRAQSASLDAQIQTIENEINNLKHNNLYKTKEEIQTASQTLDQYLDELNTNFDFKKALREDIKARAQDSIADLEQAKDLPIMKLGLYAKLEALAEQDPTLNSHLSIDNDRAVLALLEDYVSKYSHVQPGTKGTESEQAKKERETKLKVFTDEVDTIKRRIERKGNSLKLYIVNHKADLGIPADMNIDYKDRSSVFYDIGRYADSKSNISFSDLKARAVDSAKTINSQIEVLQDYIRYADEDLLQIRRDRELELEDPKTYKKHGFMSNVKRIINGIGKGLNNWLHDKKKPFKGVFKKPDPVATLTQAKVIDSTNNFADAYKTEIGQDAYAKVIKEYNERIKNAQPQQQSRNER